MKKIVTMIVATLMLAGCAPEDLFSLVARSDIEEAASQSVAQSSDSINKIDQKIQALRSSYSQSTKLESISKDTSYAYAFNQSAEGVFKHHIVAVLPPPAEEGTFYEGWLVDEAGSKFISTGRFEFIESDGTRELHFESKTDYTPYASVVITLEKTPDQKPEAHILEGKF